MAVPPPEPMKEAVLATSGSLRTAASTLCWSRDIAPKETSGDASVNPNTRPVSSCGKVPFGIVRYMWIVRPMVSAMTTSASHGWRSTPLRLRA